MSFVLVRISVAALAVVVLFAVLAADLVVAD